MDNINIDAPSVLSLLAIGQYTVRVGIDCQEWWSKVLLTWV